MSSSFHMRAFIQACFHFQNSTVTVETAEKDFILVFPYFSLHIFLFLYISVFPNLHSTFCYFCIFHFFRIFTAYFCIFAAEFIWIRFRIGIGSSPYSSVRSWFGALSKLNIIKTNFFIYKKLKIRNWRALLHSTSNSNNDNSYRIRMKVWGIRSTHDSQLNREVIVYNK